MLSFLRNPHNMSLKHVISKNIVAVLAVAVMSVMMASCGSVKHTAKPSASASGSSRQSSHKAPPRKTTESKMQHIDFSSASGNAVTSKLLREADSWMGTPYVWGGNDRNGVDCSGFVTQVYLRSLDIKLPRTSAQQQEFCTTISRNDLQPGDLVFFTVRGGDRVGHVGIYIGDGNMVHSSSSKGVIITPLSTPYFVTNYHSAGRVERYYAMMEKRQNVKAAKTKTKAKAEPSAPNTASKPKSTPKPKPAVKQQPAKMELTTPMPAQVFAGTAPQSKPEETKPVAPKPADTPKQPQPDFEEPDPDFFD